MSYEPLHHKYRPQTFKDLVGQEAIASTLISAIKSEKIAPAYLFTGPRGTGKTSSARILAKSLNCLSYDKPTPIPCGKCEVCQAIATGNALDVIEIDAASNTGVDNIREIIERSRFAPVQSRYKVYAIDECHMLSTAAFNALLKTLEEPPSQVVFILATTDPQRVLSTIISRCQRFDYRRIRLDAMVDHLEYIARQENIAIAHEAVTLIAQIANGGLRDAESLLDQLSLFPQEITVEQIWDLVGAVPEKDLLALLSAIRKENVEDIVAQCRNLLDRGREPLVLLQNLASFYLNLLIAKTSPNRQDLVAVTETCWQQLCIEAQHWQSEAILQGQQQLKEAEVQIKHTTQPRLWLEITLLSLLNKSNIVPVNSDRYTSSKKTIPNGANSTQSITSKNENKDRNVAPSETINAVSQNESTQQKITPPSENSSQPIQTVSQTDGQLTNRTSVSQSNSLSNSTEEQAVIWQQVVECIHPPTTQALLRQYCHLISLDESAALVGITSPPLHKMHKGKVPNIETAFAKVCQRKIKVTLEVAPKQNKSANKAEKTPQKLTSSTQPRSQIAQPLKDNSPQNTTFLQRQKAALNDTTSSENSRAKPDQENKETSIEVKKTIQQIESQAVSISSATVPQTPVAEHNPLVATASTENISNSDDFTKAIELMAQKFDGEVIELQNSSPKTVVNQTKNTENKQDIVNGQKIVIKREAIADDDDVPF